MRICYIGQTITVIMYCNENMVLNQTTTMMVYCSEKRVPNHTTAEYYNENKVLIQATTVIMYGTVMRIWYLVRQPLGTVKRIRYTYSDIHCGYH